LTCALTRFCTKAPMTEIPFHCHRKNLYKGDLIGHIDYVNRNGRHKDRGDLVAAGQLNIPPGVDSFGELAAVSVPNLRKRGIAAQAWTTSLSRQLTPDQQLEATREIATKLAGGKPAEFVIHDGTSSDGGRNPHAHILIFPRVQDGIARPLENVCLRYNPKNPAAGGWKKEREATSREGVGIRLRGDRSMIAAVQNQLLAKYGHEERVDARSYWERGLAKEPGKHLYPAGMRRAMQAKQGESVAPVHQSSVT
jgi:hypothetical protein